MSDIVKNLIKIADSCRRNDGYDIPLGTTLREAAAEIGRLRSEHDAWRDAAIEQQQKLKRSEAERQRHAEVMEEVRKVLAEVTALLSSDREITDAAEEADRMANVQIAVDALLSRLEER